MIFVTMCGDPCCSQGCEAAQRYDRPREASTQTDRLGAGRVLPSWTALQRSSR